MHTKMLLSTGALVAVLVGCASSDEEIIIGTPAPNSKFAKVEIGMGKHQVESLIGRPDDFEFHTTGKEFIPLYSGGDIHRLETYYKNEGRLTYSSAEVLIHIEVDPNATGYR
jgi:hypothetical protein